GRPPATQPATQQTEQQTTDNGTGAPVHSEAPRVMPVGGPVTYEYGWLPKGKQPHEGLDLAAKVGDPVVAMAEGTVLRVGTDDLAGALVEVDHGFAVVTYGQVTAARVKAGDHVQQGQRLADVAKPTGKEGDTGAHLHLEVRPARGAKPIDPAPYLPLNGGSDS
ncbi:MAG TPA: M23 family metallopeptidase, partial [Symbiobacteriaceae bacterium]|nr:M23 family metallopeptidase [Symbiobacteriaceae bacterium]